MKFFGPILGTAVVAKTITNPGSKLVTARNDCIRKELLRAALSKWIRRMVAVRDDRGHSESNLSITLVAVAKLRAASLDNVVRGDGSQLF